MIDELALALGAVRQDLVRHLVGRLLLDDAAAHGAVRYADARVEQAQVVVDLRHGAHRSSAGFCYVVFWSMETAGDRPSMESTSGFSICPRNWRA